MEGYVLQTRHIREVLDSFLLQQHDLSKAEPALKQANLVNDILARAFRTLGCLVFGGKQQNGECGFVEQLLQNRHDGLTNARFRFVTARLQTELILQEYLNSRP